MYLALRQEEILTADRTRSCSVLYMYDGLQAMLFINE